ncbi:MAG TPA: pepsin/retropepsin-like aspartic protease family protein, partial [Armatimonadota bacterium]|nr:pepsin/retropepsin-like aspartic protease family protein [Armatimonadota bacterium]
MKNVRGQAVVSCLFVLISLSIAPTRASGATARHSSTTPIEFTSDGMPTVTVRINGAEARMMLDTGTNTVAVTDAFVKRAGLSTRTFQLPATASHKGAAVVRAVLPDMVLGDFRENVADALIVKSIRTQDERLRIDGVLGWPVLQQFAGLIDFGARRLTLWYPSGLSPDEIKAAGMNGAKPVPLVAGPDGYCHVTIKIGSSTFDVRLDTGAEGTSLTSAMAAELKLRPLAQQDVAGVVAGVWGVNIARCPVISVGSAHFGPGLVEYPVLSDNTRAPLFGMDTLKYSRIFFDPGTHQMRFAALPGHLPAGITPDWSVCRAPMRLVGENQLPVIGVQLPDQKLHWFGLTFDDFGYIADHLAASLAAPEHPVPGRPGVTETNVDLSIGGHAIQKAEFAVVPPKELGVYPAGIEGVIGFGLLAGMAVKIDPASSLAEVIFPGPAGLLPPPPAGEDPVGISPGAGGAWYVKAWVDGSPISASPSLDTRENLDSVGAGGHGPPPKRPFALNSEASHLVAGRFQSLRVGNFAVRGPEVLELSDSIPAFVYLGFDFFRGRSLYLDAPMGAIYMTQKAPISPPALDEYQGTGIES